MTTKEAFFQLTSKRGWWVGILKNSSEAAIIKYDFLHRRGVSDERMTALLLAAGKKIKTEKTWEKF